MIKKISQLSFLISLSLTSTSYGVDNPGNDPIARYYQPAYLFNQDDIFANLDLRETFQEMGFSDRDLPNVADLPISSNYHSIDLVEDVVGHHPDMKLLENEIIDEFYKRRRILYGCAIFQEFVGASSLPILLGVAAGIAYGVMGTEGSYFTSLMIMNAMYTFVTGSYGLKNLMGALLNPSNDCLLPYELAYAKQKFAINFLDRSSTKRGTTNDVQRSHQEDFLYPEKLFLVARRSPENFLKTTQFFDTLLNLPYKSARPQPNWERLKKSLALYKETTGEIILACCMNHVYSYQEKLGFNRSHKELLLLVSPPGSGKTTLVSSLGDNMGLNSVSICLAGCTVESLQGNENTPGLLLQSLVQLQDRNGILFLDELDKVMMDLHLLGILLPLIESGVKKFYSPYLRRSIDISHLLVIAAVNDEFTKEQHLSLKDRFPKRVDLTIVNKEEMMRILTDSYLANKLTKGEQNVDDYYNDFDLSSEQDNVLSFRAPQAAIDLSLGQIRLRRHKVLL